MAVEVVSPVERFLPVTPFDEAPLRAFLGSRAVVAAGILPGGRINSNYRVDLSDGTRVVVRYYGKGSPAVERAAMDLVKGRLPVPEILDAGESWAVMRFLPGEPLAIHPAAARAAGRALATVASVALPWPGTFGAGGAITPFPFDGLAGFIREAMGRAGVGAILGSRRVASVERLLVREAGRMSEIDACSVLSHGDFNPANILVADGQVTGVLDWEFAHSGSPWMDPGNLLRDLPPQYHEDVARGMVDERFDLAFDWRYRAQVGDLTSRLDFSAQSTEKQ